MTRITLCWDKNGAIVKKVLKLPPSWDAFSQKIRELTGLTQFIVLLEPVGGEIAQEDFDVIEHNDVLKILAPGATWKQETVKSESPQVISSPTISRNAVSSPSMRPPQPEDSSAAPTSSASNPNNNNSKGKEEAPTVAPPSSPQQSSGPADGATVETTDVRERKESDSQNRAVVRLPTRLDLAEGVGDTGLVAYMLGFFWLSHQKDLMLLLKSLKERMSSSNSQRSLRRKLSLPDLGEESSPTRIYVENPRFVSCGHNSVAIVDAEGGLWMYGPPQLPHACFGGAAEGVSREGLSARLVRVDCSLPIRNVSCGSYFGVAEAEGGQIFSWGLNSNLCTTGINGEQIAARIAHKGFQPGGQLGREETEGSDSPDLVMRTKRCVSLACGTSHTFLVSEEGTFGWGCNEESQLGPATTASFASIPSVLSFPPLQSTVKQVACGSHHTIVLCDNGSVWTWGWNKSGQLGRSHPSISDIPLRVLDVPLVASVSAGEGHSVVLCTDNSVWSWGSNRYGELGRIDGNYLPAVVKLPALWAHERVTVISSCGYSSALSTASGLLFVWGFLKSDSLLDHQPVPRLLPLDSAYIAQFGLGLCHVALCCDENLGQVLNIIRSTNGNPADERGHEIAAIMARARGDVLHDVQNRGLALLSSEIPRVKCNVAYLVTNTQLLIVNFSQVLVSSMCNFPIHVRARIPFPKEIPSGCDLRVEPEEFRLAPGDVVTLNVTVNVSKSVTENVTTLLELLVSKEKKRKLFRKNSLGEVKSKYFFVLAFPYTPMLNGRSDDTSAYLLARFCSEGDVAAIKNILDRGDGWSALMESHDYEGRTPLFVAAQSGHLNVVRLLVARGANVNAADAQGSTPLAAAYSNNHSSIVEYLLSVGASLDARRIGTSPEELAFLRAANKLYLGARKQDLTALDEDDLLSLQAALLQKMKQYSMTLANDASSYSIEKVAIAPATSPPPTDGVIASTMPAHVTSAWKAASTWSASSLCWNLKCPVSGSWETRLTAAVKAAARMNGASAWSTGVHYTQDPKKEQAILFWVPVQGSPGDWQVFCVGRAADDKSFGGWSLLNMLLEDLVLRVWGNSLFEGVSSVPTEAPLGAWETNFVCPECIIPDVCNCNVSSSDLTLLRFETVEMAVVLGHATVRCSKNHRVPINRIAPNLTLEHLQDIRMSEESIGQRLQVGTRIGAGGFSHIYLAKLKTSATEDEWRQVAVKQYIQRKPIMFSFDTPEERAAKEMELEQGAMVVFRRLHHEVQMLAIRRLSHVANVADEVRKDAQRILGVEGFSFKPPYVITTYYDMGDLYRLLHNTFAFPSLDVIWLIGVAIDCARGMRFLHTHVPPLCHRDFKTPNVYLTSTDPNAEQRAIVGDMGTVVPMFESLRTDAAPVTNPIWMAPELISRKAYGLAADVYSFAIVLWELATRNHPFTSITDSESLVDDKPILRAAIINGERPPVPEACPFGSDYCTLMTSCWDADPQKRPGFDEILTRLVKIKNTLVAIKSK